MANSEPGLTPGTFFRRIKARISTFRHKWFRALVWFLFGFMTLLLYPGMAAVWCWRKSRRPLPRGGRRLSMLLLSALAAVFQLLWLNLLVIDPMAGTGEARDTSRQQSTADGPTSSSEPVPDVDSTTTLTTATGLTEAGESPSTSTTTVLSEGDLADASSTTTMIVEAVTPEESGVASSGAPGSITTSTAAEELTEGIETVSVVLAWAEESDGGVAYDRDLYGSWTTVRSGCNTRCAVLDEERRSDGTWLSWYDGRLISDPSDLDIDHMVPLAEAHSSGGWQWSSSQKRRYANDIEHPQALTAVSASSNRSKGSRDPAEWKPSNGSAWCRYATDWITVKVTWNLTADRAEIRSLEEMLGYCDSSVTITTVPVSIPSDAAATTSATVNAAGSCPYTSAAGDPCEAVPGLANTQNDVNCADIPSRYRPLTVVGADRDRLDGNNDGEACSR